MTFAHPWMLLGLLAAFLPLLVHLFDRRRPRQVPFGAISFVLRSQRRTASRLRLKRLLLYLLRTLLFLVVPLALARPQLSQAQAATTARGAAATAVVVDLSLGMRFQDGDRRLHDRALDEARTALKELLSEEPATLLGCTPAPRPPAPVGFDRPRLLALVDELQPTWGPVDLNRCLELATKALDDNPLAGRRLIVISAFTQGALRLEAPPPVSLGPRGETVKPEVVLRDVAVDREVLPNRAIVDMKAEPALQAGPRAWQFTFTVRNFGPEPVSDLELQLKVDGAVVAKGFLDLAGGGTSQKTLTWRFAKGGVTTVEGVLSPDALPGDDVRAVVLSVPKSVKALLVNGAPSPQKVRDEAFFTDAALSSPGSPLTASVRDADAAWREDFTLFDEVYLLNAPAPPPEVAARLRAFVEAGGGLFLSMGDRVDPDAYNNVLGALLPRPLRVVKTAVEPGAPDAAARAARLQQVDLNHPVLSPFSGRAREGLLSARFSRYVLFESDAQGKATEVLGTLDDGAPVFLAARLGKGRVFAFASTVDTDWSDFPIRTAFLPLVQRVAAWLSGSLDEREAVRARVGDWVTLTAEGEVTPSVVRSPSGKELPARQPPGATAWTAGPVDEPGAWAVLNGQGQSIPALSFAATLDPAASDLARHREEDVTAWFGEEQVRSTSGGGSTRRTPLWTWLLVAAALALFGEGLLLRR